MPSDHNVNIEYISAYMGLYDLNRDEAMMMASRDTICERINTLSDWHSISGGGQENATSGISSVEGPTPSNLQNGTARDHFAAAETHLVKRWTPVGNWFHERGKMGLDPYQKSVAGKILPYISGRSRDGTQFAGVNFASQDYLSLSSHPRLVKAASAAAVRFGVHSAGSAALMGNSDLSLELEKRLETYLGFKECTLFPTGWTAGYGIVKMLAQPGDHIVMDVLAHACLQEGAEDSGAKVHRFPHLSNEGVERRLRKIIGIEAVIDKYFASALLVRQIRAQFLLILADVDAVYRGWGVDDAIPLGVMRVSDLTTHDFPAGSMRRKVEAGIGALSR